MVEFFPKFDKNYKLTDEKISRNHKYNKLKENHIKVYHNQIAKNQ